MYHEDIGIHGFEFGNNYNNNGCVKLLNLLVCLCPGKWLEQLGSIHTNIVMDNNSKVTFLFCYYFDIFIFIYTTKRFLFVSFYLIFIE